ncbi:MAG: hypothetical protein J3Q66DRAFT_397625 [Benniella sp.]|nr:MAG: hypothetical protein J3Q66DRAFT_397625 [Benniella sp.]
MESAGAIREQLAALHLQRLEFLDYSRSYGVHRAKIRVLPLLERISTLQHLRTTLSMDRDNNCQRWLRTLEALPHLVSLSLRCERFVDGKVIPRVLRLCHRYRRLTLRFSTEIGYIEECDTQEYKDAKAAIEEMPEMRLCELSFCSGNGLVGENVLQPLLERCPRVERLDLSIGTTESTFQHFFKMLKENKLPKLRHLTASGPYETHLQAAFSEALSHVEYGIESLTFWHKPSDPVVQSLTQHHYSSLTKLSLPFSGIPLWTLSKLMAGLPNLRSFRGCIQRDYSPSNGVALDMHWGCVGLRNLRLYPRTNTSGTVGDSRWKGSAAEFQFDYVFSEVSKLESLQELIIECDMNNLYLKRHGYLAQLAGLKELKVFDLAKVSHKSFGKQEALWMVKNWPKLLQVYAEDIPAIFNETLLEKRPMVEVTRKRFPMWDAEEGF